MSRGDYMDRIVISLRVSSKQQTATDKEVPIPTQREIVHKAIERHYGNTPYIIVKEFVEAGISAFKTSSQDRDVIQDIKEMASKKEFDVLWAYHSNRIGRRTEDGPADIKFLNEHGIDVWTPEGEISTKTQIDKLITYIDFWENESESVKKSQIITDHQMVKVEHGEWRGGNIAPYGYELVDNGSKNFKGRHILDLIVNEMEAELIIKIYDLSIDSGYGALRIAELLNEQKIYTRHNKPWNSSTILRILKNPTYKGYLHGNFSLYNKSVVSDKQVESMVIIPEDRWELNKTKMKRRKQIRTNKLLPRIGHGKLLFNGFVFCGYCGSRMTTYTSYSHWKTKDGVNHISKIHKYRCGSFDRGKAGCSGQKIFNPEEIEPKILDDIKSFLLSVSTKKLNEAYQQQMAENEASFKKEYDRLNGLSKGKERELLILRQEIHKAIMGESYFTEKDLAEQISNAKKELDEIIESKERQKELFESRRYEKNTLPSYEEWNEKFNEASFEKKKALIGLIVDKVIIFRDRCEMYVKISKEVYDDFACINDDGGTTPSPKIHDGTLTVKRTVSIWF